MECAAPLNEVHGAFNSEGLQWETLASEKDGDDVGREKGRELVAAGRWLR